MPSCPSKGACTSFFAIIERMLSTVPCFCPKADSAASSSDFETTLTPANRTKTPTTAKIASMTVFRVDFTLVLVSVRATSCINRVALFPEQEPPQAADQFDLALTPLRVRCPRHVHCVPHEQPARGR